MSDIDFDDFSMHKTSTGKIFQIVDYNNNPLEYDKYRSHFTRSFISLLQVGQQLDYKSEKILLKRLK